MQHEGLPPRVPSCSSLFSASCWPVSESFSLGYRGREQPGAWGQTVGHSPLCPRSPLRHDDLVHHGFGSGVSPYRLGDLGFTAFTWCCFCEAGGSGHLEKRDPGSGGEWARSWGLRASC